MKNIETATNISLRIFIILHFILLEGVKVT